MSDYRDEIASKIQDAFKQKQALQIKSGNTKHFYGRNIQAETLSVANHTDIIEYEPSELYITARSGTSLIEIEQAVADQNQILPCEPPHFGTTATLGGMVACGLAGPRRVNAGNVRDCILGTEILNGKGELLRFGGKVMKNVAGYDVSRLMCGALGTLGVLMSVSLRLLPKPSCEQTIAIAVDSDTAINKMNQWASTPMPISATFYDGNELYIRLSSSATAVKACKKIIDGHQIEENDIFWNSIKEQTHDFFNSDIPLWRISVPPNTETLNIPGVSVMEWNGALRWYKSDANENTIRSEAERVSGHANLFRGNVTQQVFHPLTEPSMKLHKKIKLVLDPASILNPAKMFAEL
jgi:glycolate oxidase FAD binding subunit